MEEKIYKAVNGERVEMTSDEVKVWKANQIKAVEERQAEIFPSIKKLAGSKIEKVFPLWKQANANAKAAELSVKGDANWDAFDEAAWDEVVNMWEYINDIRAKSNTLEELFMKSEADTIEIQDEKYWA